MWLPVAALAEFSYRTENGSIIITGYAGICGEVDIPDNVDGLPVTQIGSFAFYENSTVTSVTLPNSLVTIDSRAFARCANLASITIPASVAKIAYAAFSGCGALTTIVIPEGITAIEESVFAG